MIDRPSLTRAALTLALKEDFSTFLAKSVSTLDQGDKLKPNWHHDAIGHRLSLIEEHGGGRLIVTVPPRSLKSITISVAWTAYMLGRNPALRFVCISYSQDLALKHARDCRTLMESAWYRQAFPNTVLSRLAEHDLRTTAGGGRYSTSVGGTLTGLGGKIIIIDDPIKPDEGHSEPLRAKCIDWYGKVLSSRLDDKVLGSIILVMQRVHENDLAGHLLAGGGWDHLNLPAIATSAEEIPLGRGRIHRRSPGDLLHPEHQSQKVLDELRAVMGSITFEAQCQQSPIPLDGNIFKAGWFRRYPTPPTRRTGDLIIQSWDTASQIGLSNDYSACITALQRRDEIYVLDVFRGRLTFPELRHKVVELAQAFNAGVLLIEDAASGQQLLQTLKAEPPRGVPRPIGRKPEGNKIVRANRPSADVEAGKVLLPEEAPWLGAFLGEALGFPNATYDDQVDALSQLLNWATPRRSSGRPCGPILYYEDEYGHIRTEGSVLGDGERDRAPVDRRIPLSSLAYGSG